VRRSRKFLLLLLAVFLAPSFALGQMPSRQPGGSPGSYPGGASPGPPNIPDNPAPSAPSERSKIIYVTDFELHSISLPADASSTPPATVPPHADPSAARAQHLTKLMSDNLLKDFAKAGYTAKLLHPSDPRPDDGFLITGVFAQVGEDNRLRRAVIGSSHTAETLQLYVAAKDLAHFTPPLYTADPADASASSAKPDAAIEINPNAEAAKYSIEADITDKDIKQTAQRVTTDLAKRITAAEKSEGDPLNRYAKP
jgi:hypothetical protein